MLAGMLIFLSCHIIFDCPTSFQTRNNDYLQTHNLGQFLAGSTRLLCPMYLGVDANRATWINRMRTLPKTIDTQSINHLVALRMHLGLFVENRLPRYFCLDGVIYIIYIRSSHCCASASKNSITIVTTDLWWVFCLHQLASSGVADKYKSHELKIGYVA